jgi:alanyl-tRNA synthetase
VGYHALESESEVLAHSLDGEAQAIVLRESPFYATSGGQVADTGTVTGEGWTFTVTDVQRDAEFGQRLLGTLDGTFAPGTVRAAVDAARRRDIERNHSATHLVHLVLRERLGDHVRQQGSLVEPSRLRFDFSHHGPVDSAQLAELEAEVNELVLANAPVEIREMPYPDALQLGAMAFFADKYGDVVRVVQIGDSIELCGGTHVRSAGQVGLFRFASQGGVAAGVRRIEALTGHGAYAQLRDLEERIAAMAARLKAQPDQVERRLDALLAERERLELRLAELMKSGGSGAEREFAAGNVTLVVAPTVAEDRTQLGEIADQFRAARGTRAVLALINPTAPAAVSFAVTDDLVARGKDANALMKLVTTRFQGRGGGRKTFASGSLGSDTAERVVTEELPALLHEWVGA